ncbi:Flp family type IVb pilin [Enterovirga sp. CN4-39]|uniref:Flp family type IVb pilin n=1 Tax=Enterovirga sp. CN4-39 TaxID=3400910 RepID=UPI003BFBB6E3
MSRFLRDQKGVTSIEYALIAMLVSIVIIGGATMIGTSVRGSFEQVQSGFTTR